jgi:hypothetical protein
MTPEIIQAAKDNKSQRLRTLILDGADPNTRDEYGETGMTWAARLGHTAIIKDLLACQADQSLFGDLFRSTPLQLACHAGHRGIVALLSVLGDVNRPNQIGRTPLMLTVQPAEETLKPERRILGILKILFENDVDLDAVDLDGNTALHHAVNAGIISAVEALRRAGARADIRNQNGETARDLADFLGRDELLPFLR